jgi:hypothetical protein
MVAAAVARGCPDRRTDHCVAEASVGASGGEESGTVNTRDLARELIDAGYIQLFMLLGETAADVIWRRPGAREALRRVLEDPALRAPASFLAAEVLFRKDPSFPTQSQVPRLARVYAAALAEQSTRMANPWGLPGLMDGDAGRHLVRLGDAVVPELHRLMDDDGDVVYGGSQEATFGNSYRYRVKDLAAFFLSRIRRIPFEVSPDPAVRDRRIHTLRDALAKD